MILGSDEWWKKLKIHCKDRAIAHLLNSSLSDEDAVYRALSALDYYDEMVVAEILDYIGKEIEDVFHKREILFGLLM